MSISLTVAVGMIVLTLVNLGVGVWLIQNLRRNRTQLHQIQSQVAATRNVFSKQQSDLRELSERKDVLEQVVNGGTSAVESVHRAISDTTFTVIDRLTESNRVRAGNRQVRDVHDQTAQGVYRSIRVANRELHSIAETLLKTGKGSRRRNDNDTSE